MFKRLTGALFGGAAAAPASAPAAGPRRNRYREIAHANFQNRIAELLEQHRDAVAGKMQFVDMDEIKAELGERWEAIAGKVREVTERTIQRRLAPEDAYVAYDKDSFLLLFANLNEAQARIKAMAIANEIRQLMTGEFDLTDRYWVRTFVTDLAAAGARGAAEVEQLDALLNQTPELTAGRRETPAWTEAAPAAPVARTPAPEQTAAAQAHFEARVSHLSREFDRGSAGKLELLQLDELKREMGGRWTEIVERVRTITENVLTRRLERTDVFAPVDEGTWLVLFAALDEDEARLKIAAIAREIRDRLLGELGPALEPEIGAFAAALADVVPPAVPIVSVPEINRVLSERENMAPPRDTAPQAELRQRLGEVGVTYRPTWFVARGMISTFDARAMRLDPGDVIRRGIDAYPANDPPVCFEIDRTVLQRALHDARRLVEHDDQALITVPLRLQSLIDHSSGQLVDLCRAQPVEVRRAIVIEIGALLADAPTTRLYDAVTAIQPFCRALIVRVPPSFTEFDRLARLGIYSVGLAVDAGMPERTQLEAFARAAHAQGLATHMHGIGQPSLLAAARAAGIDYLNGPAIAPEVVRPVAMYAYDGAR